MNTKHISVKKETKSDVVLTSIIAVEVCLQKFQRT
jgi:hypothetical protein